MTLLLLLGTVPSELCNIHSLTYLHFEKNAEITCYAACLSSVSSFSTDKSVCMSQSPTSQNIALCAFVAATNISSRSVNSDWMCDKFGIPINNPCNPVWTGLNCLNDVVTSMDLSKEGLTGSIPPELGQLYSLTYLDLQYNSQSSSVPSVMIERNLFNTGLTGNIPFELSQLTSLVHMDLNSNDLSGNIPPELGQLSSLVYLDLSFNELSGE